MSSQDLVPIIIDGVESVVSVCLSTEFVGYTTGSGIVSIVDNKVCGGNQICALVAKGFVSGAAAAGAVALGPTIGATAAAVAAGEGVAVVAANAAVLAVKAFLGGAAVGAALH